MTLPESAQQRLAELSGLNSSFFSAYGDAVAESAGVHALGQVLGAKACRHAIGVVRRTRDVGGSNWQGAWREHDGPRYSWGEARRGALAGLLKEASMLGADAVLGVRAQRFDERACEVILEGTAVALDRKLSRGLTASFVTPQEFVRLRAAGIEVAGIVGAYAEVSVTMGQATNIAVGLGRRSPNQELGDLTIGVYEARRLTMERLRRDARGLGADGLIGIDIADSLRRSSSGAFHVHAWGSAVRRVRALGPRGPRSVLTLR